MYVCVRVCVGRVDATLKELTPVRQVCAVRCGVMWCGACLRHCLVHSFGKDEC